ncbi:Xylose isomerase domain protein TIM barrel [Beutenbergia cavernae DSM 12333]|uniref:Xylose isomerase domain protein TIM barrel n=1 Tax=Beutenbergia cavernae (strain ATCC BAA-8 / DSM 12333 / CCUG 43141 / JCM 11478 / NBRC 16432 / NCIMB 13614 / HKI 0122) TaxID=471853 RepID=C5C1E9_BEUC1|nr:sugar phosphate isomerase/epimerase family protein [Beutenbergia cavernae]ACQ81559.1 Xylose isomerase domain protein TIM barrel [Beutenbergia cavernae DSM 12333]
MRFSVFTASTPEWTPAEAVAQLAAQGWDGVEWRVVDQPAPAGDAGFWSGNRATWPLAGVADAAEEIARTTTDGGLVISALAGYARCYERDDVEQLLLATARSGAQRVRVTVPALGTGTYPELFAQAREDYTWVAERAAAHGVKALVELHHQTITASASAALRLLDGLDPAHVGVIHDLGNLVIEGWEDPQPALEMLGDYLAHVHLKNAVWRPTGERDASGATVWEHAWAPLREGQASVLAYFRALAAVGYDDWVTVEDFSTEVPLAERTADNLAYLRATWDLSRG